MFLRNERGLGVKNGTLGTVERISAQSMAVRTDDGSGGAFDTKNYARIDHGAADQCRGRFLFPCKYSPAMAGAEHLSAQKSKARGLGLHRGKGLDPK